MEYILQRETVSVISYKSFSTFLNKKIAICHLANKIYLEFARDKVAITI